MSTRNERLATMFWRERPRRRIPLREDWLPVPRTARTAATVAAPATIPPAAAIAAVRTSPRQRATPPSVAFCGSGRGSSLVGGLVARSHGLLHRLRLEYGIHRHGRRV